MTFLRVTANCLWPLLVCALLSGCVLFERSASCTTRKLLPPSQIGKTSEQEDRSDFCHYRGALARWYVPYAVMSLNVYRPDGLDDDEADKAKSCAEGGPKIPCPKSWQNSRWQGDVERDNRETGLYMEAFKRDNGSERRREVVIAFRGTEWRDLKDWRANLRWFMPVLNRTDEYPLARRKAVEWVALACQGLGSSFDKLTVVMTGHSLGGGLAQNAAYAVQRSLAPALVPQDGGVSEEERKAHERLAGCPYKKVTVRTVAFDPSPVTGYRDGQAFDTCDNPLSTQCRRPIVIRLYERGEILSGPRRILSWFNPLATNICEDRHDLGEVGLPITQHQMRRITSGLLWLATMTGDQEAAEIYTRYCPLGGSSPDGALLCHDAKFDCPLEAAR